MNCPYGTRGTHPQPQAHNNQTRATIERIKNKHILELSIALLFLFPKEAIAEPAPLEIIRVLSPQEYAKEKVIEKWGEAEWSSFDTIIIRESNWNHLAANPTSSARGYCQTMMSLHKDVSADFLTNPNEQIDWCVKYIATRYQTPSKALQFWNANKWF